MTSLAPLDPADRLPLVEPRPVDFPFYRGHPLAPTAMQWAIVLLATLGGFLALSIGVTDAEGPAERAIRSVAFLGLPVAAFVLVIPGSLRALFSPLRWRDIGVILFCLVLGLIVSGVVGFFVSEAVGAAENPANEAFATDSAGTIAAFFAATLIQLPGEEFLALVPFLAVLAFAHGPLGLSRRKSVLLAWLVSSLIFGAAHLPTYDWNWVQCLVVIGSARIILTLSYVITKNVAVSSIVHIMNDWLLFGSAILLSASATP